MATGTMAATGGRAGGEMLTLAEAGVVSGIHPSRIYSLGVRGELELVRDDGRWLVARWAVESLAAREGGGNDG